MVWFPGASAEVVKVAWPTEFRVTVARVVDPSRNWIVPVATVPVVATVAVKVTVCPAAAGFAEETNAVVLDARLTVCVRRADVLVRQLAPPP